MRPLREVPEPRIEIKNRSVVEEVIVVSLEKKI